MANATFVCVAFYTEDGEGKTGLADVTFDIDQIDSATPAMTAYLTAQAATEVRNGEYRRFFTGDAIMTAYPGCRRASGSCLTPTWSAELV